VAQESSHRATSEIAEREERTAEEDAERDSPPPYSEHGESSKERMESDDRSKIEV